MDQPQSSGDFGHGCFSRPYTKLTYSFSYYRSKGTSLPQPETRSQCTYKTSSLRPIATRKLEKHKLCLSMSYYYNYNHIVAAYYGTTKPTVYSYRRQWNPCHMDFGLVPASH